ncbi:glycoside hydrolase/phage tail family protein [Paracoccus sp. TK19116]|uniref:Glycoside hydrolase/phage tail family protein n=1 Tax=Paracoccus albicereus TaxID=2922394 RepID=A0ABT1MUJ5_9RHOB|nr:glycoside hydrolase/phage tail family protein [Paracoccus albicereus]MCQ0971876.1 glycoside hydrolase/phage tail family protein [Paracoccus albicereus]
MATLVLSAVGASLGSGFGGTLLGLSGAVVGRAVGASVGRVIDQRLLGQGSKPVETGRIDRLRLQSAGEGMHIPKVWGQMRVPGHVIWASPLEEVRTSQGGAGKGAPQPQVTEISYTMSVALALCEGAINGVGRVWADGEEVTADDLNMRVYEGDESQLPDSAIVSWEGAEAPAYRGIAYVVLENLSLERWGNRMPQLSFEVTRPAQTGGGVSRDVRAVAMIPGTGEYALATSRVEADLGLGETVAFNENTPLGGTDFSASLKVLERELPRAKSVSLVVSWFGDDLRIGRCEVRPKVEYRERDGGNMPWRAGGIARESAREVARRDGRPIYGGTPGDQSVVEALRALAASGRKAVFYPFILMEQQEGNGLPDPYGGGEQAPMPWRGRITTEKAPGQAGSTDGSAAAAAEVAQFFGTAKVEDFQRDGTRILYSGPSEWSYRRFILHYAHLCAAAGGVDTFLIGSEMVGMTQIRTSGGRYPAVAALVRLAADCRRILGPDVKLSYAADWSEYFGHHPGGGDVRFHLDPLWADANIDFVGIDNYMPLSDWRDGDDHLDAHWGSVRNPRYLAANVAGGEGYDWYYPSEDDRRAQRRVSITDGAHDEPWVWRYKDLRGWWGNTHHERIGGVRKSTPTEWVPASKPFWFTEYGCAALDKATNQPNKFLDAFSSESALPHFSNGMRDDALQAAYLEAVNAYWADPANNPRMADGRAIVDMGRAHVWCWDARPYPAFPQRHDLWSDGPAWERGHWLNGRAGAVPLSGVVTDICVDAGVTEIDVTRLEGLVRGFALEGAETGRSALQPLMLAFGFDAIERDGMIRFVTRSARAIATLKASDLALSDDLSGLELTRAPEPELAGQIRLTHIEAGGDYETTTAETMLPDDVSSVTSETEYPLALTRPEGRAIAQRWLAESRVARDSVRFALPPSRAQLGAGDIIRFEDGVAEHYRWRIDRVERAGVGLVDAVRVDDGAYQPAESLLEVAGGPAYRPLMPVWATFLDLPLLRGDELPHAPYLAATATPWQGSVAAFASVDPAGGYEYQGVATRCAVVGVTETGLRRARIGLVDRGSPLRVRIKGGNLSAASMAGLLAGANAMAIGNGQGGSWEVFQFGTATPLGDGRWEISDRLRGQAGTDGIMPELWPAGSVVVLLNKAVEQISVPPAWRGQERFWRIGPAKKAADDPSYRSLPLSLRGIGLRPYAPCHLRLDGRRISWVRRTRIEGDGWEGTDVPLGESREEYLVRIQSGGATVHEATVTRPEYTIPETVWTETRTTGAITIAVAQLSELVGAGPFIKEVF